MGKRVGPRLDPVMIQHHHIQAQRRARLRSAAPPEAPQSTVITSDGAFGFQGLHGGRRGP